MKLTDLKGILRSAYVLAHKLVRNRQMGVTNDTVTEIEDKVKDYLVNNGLNFKDCATEVTIVTLARMNVGVNLALPNPTTNFAILGDLLNIKLV